MSVLVSTGMDIKKKANWIQGEDEIDISAVPSRGRPPAPCETGGVRNFAKNRAICLLRGIITVCSMKFSGKRSSKLNTVGGLMCRTGEQRITIKRTCRTQFCAFFVTRTFTKKLVYAVGLQRWFKKKKNKALRSGLVKPAP